VRAALAARRVWWVCCAVGGAARVLGSASFDGRRSENAVSCMVGAPGPARLAARLEQSNVQVPANPLRQGLAVVNWSAVTWPGPVPAWQSPAERADDVRFLFLSSSIVLPKGNSLTIWIGTSRPAMHKKGRKIMSWRNGRGWPGLDWPGELH